MRGGATHHAAGAHHLPPGVPGDEDRTPDIALLPARPTRTALCRKYTRLAWVVRCAVACRAAPARRSSRLGRDFAELFLDSLAADSVAWASTFSPAFPWGAYVQLPNKSTVDPRPASETGPKLAAARPPHPPERIDDDALFDFDQLRESAAFVVDAVQRYRVAALATFVLALGAALALANLWPKSYEADGKLLLQRNELMASLVNPGRTIPREAESPTLAAREIVLGRENIVALMKTTNLLERWEANRSPLLRVKDMVMGLIRPASTEDERIDAMAGLIEQRLMIGTSDEGAVSFFIRWPDAESAFRLVDEAMKSFLEYRRVMETAAITESIGILDK